VIKNAMPIYKKGCKSIRPVKQRKTKSRSRADLIPNPDFEEAGSCDINSGYAIKLIVFNAANTYEQTTYLGVGTAAAMIGKIPHNVTGWVTGAVVTVAPVGSPDPPPPPQAASVTAVEALNKSSFQ